MAFDWATQGAQFTGTLKIGSMGAVGNNSPVSQDIVTNNATVKFVDNLGQQAQLAEASSGGRVQVSKAGDSPANAYVLPWTSNYASKTRLAAASTMFVTPDLNGCAIFVSGELAGPTVVHINSKADILDKGEPPFLPLGKGATTKEINSAAAAYGREMNAFKTSYKNPMWDALYQAMAIKLVGAGLIPKDNLKLWLPTDYLGPDVTTAAVFGTFNGTWSFFCNVNGKTTKFWP